MTPAVNALLDRIRRRLRLAWMVATAELVAPVAALAALVFVMVGWLRPWAWPEPAALAVAAIAVLAVVVGAMTLRITPKMAARAADSGLGTKDAFSSVLQFDSHDRFGERIVERARAFASTAQPSDAVSLSPEPRRWMAAGLVAIGALMMAFVANPQDDIRAESAANLEAIEIEAAQLEETAAQLGDLSEPSEQELALAEELQRLAEELRQLDDPAQAASLLQQAQADFTPEASQRLATKAAVQGLERSLESQPLPGATGSETSAEEQLQAAANALDGLSEEEAEALADRLDALAETQEAGNASAAQALADAAAALRSGDTAGAEAALGEAAGAQSAGQGQVREGDSAQAAAGAAGNAAQRLQDRAEGREGEGQGEGEGEGQGEGQGQGEGSGSGDGQGEGSGSGDAQGEGQAQGQGEGSGSGSPSGEVTGALGGTGAGQGGVGTPNGSGESTDVGNESQTPSLFLPGGDSEELFPNNGADGESETVGLGEGATSSGGSQVPVRDVLPNFAAEAIAAADDPAVPPSTRALVQRYFDSLAGF